MATINFVPDDYIEQRQSSRTNLLYLMLLTAMLGAIGVTFGFIKMRQRSIQSELAILDARMNKAHEQIAQLEELKTKSKTMMKTMVMTAELLEPVPRSIVLAELTNDLPSGVSLIEFSLDTKEIQIHKPVSKNAISDSQYNSKSATANNEQVGPEIKTETNLNLKGIAPSDIQVASYIANLSSSILLGNVELVESKELEIENVKFREFRLKASLKPNMTLTKEDINEIREKAKETI
ncbi:MAG: PilN domain-containing protein [Phycisphaerae bacterium]|nr:PilN domain-containing protein [Phycisphaerae bacterium]